MSSKLPLKGVLGLGKESTNYYLSRIHQKFNELNGGFSTCPLIMYQVDFQEINPFLPDQFLLLKPKLEAYLKQISDLGISKLIIPNITLHETLDQLEIPLEICHPVDLTIKNLKVKGVSEITVFGTIYTMNSDYLEGKFSKEKINITQPSNEDQSYIDDFRKLVYEKKTTQYQIEKFDLLIQKYSEKQPVVIACTELSVFAPTGNASVLDMAELQIEDFLR